VQRDRRAARAEEERAVRGVEREVDGAGQPPAVLEKARRREIGEARRGAGTN
jgi:hypothetical protein